MRIRDWSSDVCSSDLELALGADLAGHARHLAGEAVELVDHDVDGVLEFENLALDVDGDLFRQVSRGNRGCDFGDVADLPGQVRGDRTSVVSGKSVSVRLDLGGRRLIKKKKKYK